MRYYLLLLFQFTTIGLELLRGVFYEFNAIFSVRNTPGTH